MSWRRQLPVASPIAAGGLARAFGAAIFGSAELQRDAKRLVEKRLGAASVALTDSGTSALVLALRLAVPKGGTVAFPGYACVDLAAAARFAGVRVRVYDVDPSTLSADLDSVERTLRRGVDAILVAHLFGYASDVPAVRAVAKPFGVPVIEDAAQGAGGRIGDRLLGSFGDLSVLSFGRGKGLCAGGGGALAAFSAPWTDAVSSLAPSDAARGVKSLVATGVQWGMGRPSLYALPAMLPWLKLGEMVFHEASEPSGFALSSAALLRSAMALEDSDVVLRRTTASALDAARVQMIARPKAIDGSTAGYLRYAVRDLSGRREVNAALGIVRPYPRTLLEQEEMRAVLHEGEPSTPGASTLRESLFALPTHRFVNAHDLERLRAWLVADHGVAL